MSPPRLLSCSTSQYSFAICRGQVRCLQHLFELPASDRGRSRSLRLHRRKQTRPTLVTFLSSERLEKRWRPQRSTLVCFECGRQARSSGDLSASDLTLKKVLCCHSLIDSSEGRNLYPPDDRFIPLSPSSQYYAMAVAHLTTTRKQHLPPRSSLNYTISKAHWQTPPASPMDDSRQNKFSLPSISNLIEAANAAPEHRKSLKLWASGKAGRQSKV